MNTLSTPWRALAAAVPALVLALSSVSRVEAKEGWGTNFEAAKTQAAKDKKDILMDFTGSDWCGWCIKLDEEVFSKDGFKQEAPKHFVLLELDFPQNKELPKEQTEQNEKLQETYRIAGFPTVILADAEGRPYGKTGYMAGGPEAFNEELNRLRKVRESRDAGFKKAGDAQGLDKAKALKEALGSLEPEVAEEYYQKEMDQIITLDPSDTLGLKAKKEYGERRKALDDKLTEYAQNMQAKEFGQAVDDFIAKEKVTGVDLQDLLFTKLTTLGPADLDKANDLMNEVIKIDPKSELGERAATVKEKITVMRKQIEESRKTDADKADADKDDKDKGQAEEKAAPDKKEDK